MGAIVYGVLKTKITQESKTSLPQGTDSSEMGKFYKKNTKKNENAVNSKDTSNNFNGIWDRDNTNETILAAAEKWLKLNQQ